MKRVFGTFLIITILEIWAFKTIRDHPIIWPDWFSTLLLVIQLMMGLGGIFACRWLLRKSPVSRVASPENDWAKLWLWCGPLGGPLLIKACLIGYFVTEYLGSTRPGVIVAGHIAGGAVLWTVALPWVLRILSKEKALTKRDKLMAGLGVLSHGIGIAFYLLFFPGPDVPPVSLLGAVYLFGFNLYYLMMVTLHWGLIFKFWKPEATIPTPEELSA